MASLIQRHRKKLLITSAVTVLTFITTTGVGMYFVKRWLNQQGLKIQQKKFVKEQIKRKFQQTQQDALYTVYELIPVVGLVLNNKLDLDELVHRLKNSKNNTATLDEPDSNNDGQDEQEAKEKKMTKTELWNELKLQSITKLCCAIYTLSSLLLLTKIQLNILSRREYVLNNLKEEKLKAQEEARYKNQGVLEWIGSWVFSTCGLDNQNEKENNDLNDKDGNGVRDSQYGEITEEEINYCNEQAFLSLSWWLLNKGYLVYYKIIEEEVRSKFQDLQPNGLLSIEDFSLKISQILFKTNESILSSATKDDKKPLLLSVFYPDTKDSEKYTLQQALDPQVSNVLSINDSEYHVLVDELQKCLNSTVLAIVLENLINESYKYCMNQIDTKCRRKNKKSKSTDGAKTSEASQEELGEQNAVEQDLEPSFDVYKIALLTISCKDVIQQDLLANTDTNINSSLISIIDNVPELDDLCATIYSNI
ncbi:hypothetical protein ACO0RG_000663 [Hanseniaspora osmophila]|uniref:Peroxin-3 n=1 Tax=Hanseniaspora osmophila TaxID=56408 RepID=A0A1E5R2I0_9ASCO|nr:Peroxisomal biogenesis factor 3 [Hanseniaspora osmophila]